MFEMARDLDREKEGIILPRNRPDRCPLEFF